MSTMARAKAVSPAKPAEKEREVLTYACTVPDCTFKLHRELHEVGTPDPHHTDDFGHVLVVTKRERVVY